MKNIKFLFVILSLSLIFSTVSFGQDVTFSSLGGESVTLQSQKGKVVVLAVGATWLPLSKNQAAITNKLSKKYAGRDVVVYFVATDSTAAKSKNFASNDDVQAFATRNKLTASILRDSDGAATLKRFKIDQLPAFIIFDREGKLVTEPFGGLTPTTEAENELVIQISRRIDLIL
jgi:thiol-disulfide isomerase/thioredoxin